MHTSKAMLFGASQRNAGDTPALWAAWDEFKLQDPAVAMIGWWEDDAVATSAVVVLSPPPPPPPAPSAPVPSPAPPKALVTVFSVYKDRAMFVIASWANTPVNVTLDVDWVSLGLTPGSGLKVSFQLSVCFCTLFADIKLWLLFHQVEAPTIDHWQVAMQLGDGTTVPTFGVQASGGMIVVAKQVGMFE